RTDLRSIRVAQLERNLAYREVARGKVANLKAMSLADRKSELYVETPQRLEEVHGAAMRAGLARLSEYSGDFRFSASPSQLAELGLEVRDGRVIGELTPEHVAGLLTDFGGGLDLTRARDLDPNCAPTGVGIDDPVDNRGREASDPLAEPDPNKVERQEGD